MISVTALSEYLSGNRSYIVRILTEIGYREDELRYNHKGFYQFRRLEGDNPTAMQLWTDNLKYSCYTRPEKGNIYSLVMRVKGMTFPAALKWIADLVDFEYDRDLVKIKPPFGGFYLGLLKSEPKTEEELPVYDESLITKYQDNVSYMWNQDGISYKTQEFFGVGMDLMTNSILIPERNTAGQLVGIQARSNDSNCPHEKRWWAFLPCSRNQTLFGYSLNYQYIVEKGVVFIVESEKSVMKAYEMGIRNVIAICGAILSDTQVRLLKGLRLNTYILALDDGLEEEHYKREARKLLVDTVVMKNTVYYIRDRENQYLEAGQKESPFDKSFDVLKEMTKQCLVSV